MAFGGGDETGVVLETGVASATGVAFVIGVDLDFDFDFGEIFFDATGEEWTTGTGIAGGA